MSTEAQLVINDDYIPYYENEARVLGLYGGAGSGKSYFAAQKIILRTVTEYDHKFLVLRKVGNTVKDSVFALLKDVISDLGINNEFRENKTDKTLQHKPTGNIILCKGLDEPEKIKSIQGITGVWLEEATEFEFNDFTQLLLRVRGYRRNYVQYIVSFNPISEYHWLKGKLIDRIASEEEGLTWDYLHTTYKNNHFLTTEDKAVIEDLKNTNPLYYQIYALGQWGVEDKSGKFAYKFDDDKHVDSIIHKPEHYTYLSFDFNVNPITCNVIQFYNETIYVVEAIKLANSDIYALCDHIKASYPGTMFIVTGDATGKNTSALVKDKLNYYRVIKIELDLMDTQIQVPSINPPMVENRVLVNAVLHNFPVKIDREKAAELIYDLRYVEVDHNNKIKKENRNDTKQQADCLDGFRYYLNKFHKDRIKFNLTYK